MADTFGQDTFRSRMNKQGFRMLTARQIRAARALLAWKQDELAERVGVSVPTIKRMEKEGLEERKAGTADSLYKAFTAAGIEFIDDGTKEGAAILKVPTKTKGKKK